MSKIKKIAPVLGRLALRTGVSYATLGAVRDIDEVFTEGTESNFETVTKGAISEASKKVIEETETFWQAENSRKSAMEAFRKALEELTIPNEDGEPTHNITIIVDELDRCRPDYALNMLEVIKHFFDIDGINFVLGVNMTSLEESVKARYGANIDARRYLQKFVQLTVRLRQSPENHEGDALRFFNKTIDALEIERDNSTMVRTYIEAMQRHQTLSLRSIQRLVSKCIVAGLMQPTSRYPESNSVHALKAGAQVLAIFHPDIIHQIRNGNLMSFETLQKQAGWSWAGLEGTKETNAIGLSWFAALRSPLSTVSDSTLKKRAAEAGVSSRHYFSLNQEYLIAAIEETLDTLTVHY